MEQLRHSRLRLFHISRNPTSPVYQGRIDSRRVKANYEADLQTAKESMYSGMPYVASETWELAKLNINRTREKLLKQQAEVFAYKGKLSSSTESE